MLFEDCVALSRCRSIPPSVHPSQQLPNVPSSPRRVIQVNVMGAVASKTEHLTSGRKVIHIHCNSDVDQASSIRQSGAGEANSMLPAGDELVNEGTKVVANLIMVGFLWTKNDAEPHLLGLVANIRREIEVHDCQNPNGAVVTSFSHGVRVKKVHQDLEHKSHLTPSVDEELIRNGPIEAAKELRLGDVVHFFRQHRSMRRARLQERTKLHWQWIPNLELSAVEDVTIDRLGGIIDLTLSKSHPDHHLPQHVCGLLPELLGKHRVPLYFFYGRDFPYKEPIPDGLVNVDFVPNQDEVQYLDSLPGDVAFSPWRATRQERARVFIWEEEEDGFFIRRAYNHTDAADCWDESTPNQRIYNSFSNQWDLCTALAPNEEAEANHLYDDDNVDDTFHFYQPTSPDDIIPSIPDVPGREAMEETGERAAQLLE
ncbi:hypothetical protein DFH09DRAFT_1333337 [Mycena vulgaris]|nr:hypothetical protein DFH09DRAFT_1333337 [Mycena vulgaris]